MLFSCTGYTPSNTAEKVQSDVIIPASWQTRLESGTTAHNWVAKFNDPQLSKLVNKALSNNYTLKSASERIVQLQNSELLVKANQRPGINAGAGLNTGGTLEDFDVLDNANYNASLSSRWEVDLWGQLRNEREQAAGNTAAQKANYYASRLSVVANTCRAYFNLISAQNSLSLAQETLKHYERSFKITERNYKAGIPGTDALDVQFGRNNITNAKRNLESSQLNVARNAQALQILLGDYPDGRLRVTSKLPTPISTLPSTLPEGVLEQRPDLIEARADLYVTAKEIEIREKALLPSISLTPRMGTGGSVVDISDILDPAEISWSVATSLANTLFDNNARQLQIEQTQSQYRAAIHSYSQEVLVALQEVELALISDLSLKKQTELLQKEVRVSGLAETQAQRDYTQGLDNSGILSVLESQRRAVNARSGLIRIRNSRLQNQIDLFVAMGGNPTDIPTSKQK